MFDLGIINGSLYIDGKFIESNVYINNERIVKVDEGIFRCEKTLDVEGKLVLPGFIDPHVHFSLDLGEFTSSDDFESGSKAAAFGGVTSFLDFTRPIFNHEEALEAIRERKRQAEKSCVDYSLHLTLGNFSGDIDELVKICKEEGLASIKVFTAYSESNRRCSYEIIGKILRKDILLMSHSEEDDLVNPIWQDVITYEESRPVEAEMTSVNNLCSILSSKNFVADRVDVENLECKKEEVSGNINESKGRLYIVHVSAGSTVEMVRDEFAYLLDKKIFLESCPHYFNLSSKSYSFNDGRLFLMAPPLRSDKEVKKLKKHIDYISTIGTDHCPFMKEEKFRYERADNVPKGIGGIEHSFSLMYTLFGERIIPKYTSRPAEIFGLKKKGRIREGFDADIVIYDDNIFRKIEVESSRCDYSVYENMEVRGRIVTTISRGRIIVDKGIFYGGSGKFIRR